LSGQVNHDECLAARNISDHHHYHQNNSTIVEFTFPLILYYIRRSDSLFFAEYVSWRQTMEKVKWRMNTQNKKHLFPFLVVGHTFLYNATLHDFSWEFMGMFSLLLSTSFHLLHLNIMYITSLTSAAPSSWLRLYYIILYYILLSEKMMAQLSSFFSTYNHRFYYKKPWYINVHQNVLGMGKYLYVECTSIFIPWIKSKKKCTTRKWHHHPPHFRTLVGRKEMHSESVTCPNKCEIWIGIK
jgi:hypothetical protein